MTPPARAAAAAITGRRRLVPENREIVTVGIAIMSLLQTCCTFASASVEEPLPVLFARQLGHGILIMVPKHSVLTHQADDQPHALSAQLQHRAAVEPTDPYALLRRFRHHCGLE